jgi:hypothetical protein
LNRNTGRLSLDHVHPLTVSLTALIRLSVQGVQLRSQVMDFHDRKRVFLSGPEGTTLGTGGMGSRPRATPNQPLQPTVESAHRWLSIPSSLRSSAAAERQR